MGVKEIITQETLSVIPNLEGPLPWALWGPYKYVKRTETGEVMGLNGEKRIILAKLPTTLIDLHCWLVCIDGGLALQVGLH